MTDNDLIKHIVVYGMLEGTKQPTKAVSQLKAKLLRKLQKIYWRDSVAYLKVKEQQVEVYAQAWNAAFPDDKGYMLAMGVIIGKVYESLDAPLAGRKVFERAIDSYWFSKAPRTEDDYLVEANSNRLADGLLKLLDGEKPNPLALRRKILKDNLLLEGKLKEEYV